MGVLLAGSSLKKGWGNHFSKFSSDIYYSITGCLDCLAYCGGVQMNDAVQDAVDAIIYDLKYLCDCVIPHCSRNGERKSAQTKIDQIIKKVAALKSSPVDVAFPIMALKDAAAMLDRTPTKGGVTELGAENCRKAIAQLNTISATSRKRSEVTVEDAREALNHFFDSNPPPKHIEETIRKCLQAFAGEEESYVHAGKKKGGR